MNSLVSGIVGGLVSAGSLLAFGQVLQKRDSNPEKPPVIKYEYRQDGIIYKDVNEDPLRRVRSMLSDPRYAGYEPLIWQSYDEKFNVTLGPDRHQKVLTVIWRRAVHITR